MNTSLEDKCGKGQQKTWVSRLDLTSAVGKRRSDQDVFFKAHLLSNLGELQTCKSKPRLLHNELRSSAPLPRQWKVVRFHDLRHKLRQTNQDLGGEEKEGRNASLRILLEFTVCLKIGVPWGSAKCQIAFTSSRKPPWNWSGNFYKQPCLMNCQRVASWHI